MTLIPTPLLASGDFEINVSSDAEKSIAAIASAAGWDNESRLNIFFSGSLGGPFEQDVDNAAGVVLTIQGTITGAGGDGADQNQNVVAPVPEPQRIDGEAGSPAINAQFATTIVNNGTLAGGGDGGDAPIRYSDGSGGVGGGGGGAGNPAGTGGLDFQGNPSGADGNSTTGGAGGSPDGGDGQDLGGTPAITGYSNVTYSGSGTLTGGTD